MNSNWGCSPETHHLGRIRRFLEPCDPEFWRMTLQNTRAPLLCYFKLCVSFHTHRWIQIWVASGNSQFRSKSTIFWAVWPGNLTDDLENNRAPLLCYFKLCASFRSHWWIQTGVTVQKRPIWVKFDDFLSPWPWPLTSDLDLLHGHHFGPWTSLWSLVITPENFMMIRWWEHCQKGVTDRQTDRRK